MAKRHSKVNPPARARSHGPVLGFIAVALLIVVIGWVLASGYPAWRSLGTQTVLVRYEVTPDYRIGFELGSGDLVFGKLVRGGGGSRTANLTSQHRAAAYISTSSDLASLLTIVPNPVTLEPDVSQRVTFDLQVPDDLPYGNYTGEIRIVYVRLLPWE